MFSQKEIEKLPAGELKFWISALKSALKRLEQESTKRYCLKLIEQTKKEKENESI